MTIKKRVDLHCDWPSMSSYIDGCEESDWIYGASGSVIRKEAAQRGWLRVEDFDFCGADPAEVRYRDKPYPNHAALLAGHIFTPVEEKGQSWKRQRPTCSCGWVCPDDALHVRIYREPTSLMYDRKGAAVVWLDIHVREDIAGLPPKWTREQLDDIIARAAAREAEYEAQRQAAWEVQRDAETAQAVVVA